MLFESILVRPAIRSTQNW